LYAGTDKGGLVYRISMEGKGFVLYQAAQAEVRSLLITKDFVYAGTSAPTKRGSTGSGRPTGSDGGPSGTRGADGVAAPADDVALKPTAVVDDDDKRAVGSVKGASASPFGPVSSGDNSIYRIAADGTVREIFREKTLMLSLLADGGRLLV